MRRIQTTITVNEHGTATLKLPPDIAPGEYKIVVMIERESPKQTTKAVSFPRHEISPWPFGPNETFRREDLYNEDGR